MLRMAPADRARLLKTPFRDLVSIKTAVGTSYDGLCRFSYFLRVRCSRFVFARSLSSFIRNSIDVD
jgi:hypothetical protein